MTVSGILTTAIGIDDETADRVCGRVEDFIGIHGVSWSRAVDTLIIGGFIARIGDYICDMSVDSQLKAVAERLINQ